MKEPILREIFAGDEKLTIVHILLFNYLNPLCERLYQRLLCMSNRKGNIVWYSCVANHIFIRFVSRNYTEPCLYF